MARVKPFKAWRYNTKVKSDLSKVVVPPYDVITPEELVELKALDSHSFSKIILSEGENKHQKAAALFNSWQKENVLVREAEPSFYFYKQQFELTDFELFCQETDKKLTRYGFFAVVQVEEYSNKVILPHEKTFAKYKQDRYELMTHVQGNMEPVFLGYDSDDFTESDFNRFTENSDSLCKYADRFGVIHELWKVSNKDHIKQVEEKLLNQKLYILDGHHRYETALKYYQDHKNQNTQFVLANVCAFKQKGTIILPTHRLLKLEANKELFNQRLELYFNQEEVGSLKALEDKLKTEKNICFGLKFSQKNNYKFLKIKPEFISQNKGKLDLDFLHESFLKDDLKPYYVRSIPEFDSLLQDSQYDVGFLVRPNTYDDVVGKALKNEVMPHKSTFFFPKIPSGLVIHSFEI